MGRTEKIRFSERQLSEALANYARVRDEQLPLYAKRLKCGSAYSVYYVRRDPGKKSPVWLRLGRWPEVPAKVFLARARELLSASVLQVPVTVAAAKAEFNQLDTVGDLISWYQASAIAQRDLSGQRNRNVQSVISRQLLPTLAACQLVDLSSPVIKTKLVEPMADAGYSLSYIALVLRTIKAIFAAAVEAGLLDATPVPKLSIKQFTTAPVKAKPPAYHPGQLGEVIKQIAAEPDYQLKTMMALALMFGLRVGEVASLRWQQHVDIDNGYIYLAAHETKNSQPHQLPLTDQSQQLLRWHKRQLRINGHRGRALFPAKRDPRKTINASYASSRVSLALGKGAAHDLRKLARHSWQLAGIDFYVGEILLNHKGTDLLKTAYIYMQDLLIDNCRQALSQWHQQLNENGFMEAVCGG